MKDKEGEKSGGGPKGPIQAFMESDHPAVAFSREILWVVAVVGGIALLLLLVSGTWPAVVAVESESMLPNMHVNDLVFVVGKDRKGPFEPPPDCAPSLAPMGSALLVVRGIATYTL